nr:E3 ubiquitin-protein ligase RNF14-like [Tanacetum cinerariifolium]
MMRKGKEVSLSDDIDPNKKECFEYENNINIRYSSDEDEYVDDDVLNKLENLRLCGQEADVSDQVFKDNDQLQQDEVLALESIYGEKIFILDNESGLRSFQIHIHIELPEELFLQN